MAAASWVSRVLDVDDEELVVMITILASGPIIDSVQYEVHHRL